MLVLSETCFYNRMYILVLSETCLNNRMYILVLSKTCLYNKVFTSVSYYLMYSTRLAFKKSLEPSHGVLQLLKKNFYIVLLLHLLKPLFSVFHGLQALSIFCFS